MNDKHSSIYLQIRTDQFYGLTRLSYYNVTTRFVDLVELGRFKQNLAERIC